MTNNKDGWIEWKGEECPVPPGTALDLKTRRFPDASWHTLSPENHVWADRGYDFDIVAYRLAQPLTYQHEDGKPAADMEGF